MQVLEVRPGGNADRFRLTVQRAGQYKSSTGEVPELYRSSTGAVQEQYEFVGLNPNERDRLLPLIQGVGSGLRGEGKGAGVWGALALGPPFVGGCYCQSGGQLKTR